MKKLLAVLLAAMMVVGMCSFSVAEGKTPMTPGTYTGSFQGVNDVVTVEVTVTADAIESVKVVSHQETPGIGAPLTEEGYEGATPIAVLPTEFVTWQTLNVDTVSGATLTSYALIYAVKDALTQAGANTDEWQEPVPAAEPIDATFDADVVVVGGGGAGLAAAISASQSGAESVIVVEKCGAVGGDTLVCGAIYNNPDPELQSQVTMADAKKATVEAGIAVTPVSEEHKALIDAVAAEWEEYKASGRTDLFDSINWFTLQTYNGGDDVALLPLVKVLCENSIEGFDWIRELGMGFNTEIGQGAGSLWQRTHTSTMQMGTGFISTYVKNIAADEKIAVYTSTTVEEILTDETGAVVGVKATDVDGNHFTFNAKKGVVLATGGFSANGAMIAEYNTSDKWAATDLSKVRTTNRKACSQGDGITLALGAGAGLCQMEQIQLLYLGNLQDGSLTKYPTRVVNGTDQEIFINKEGKRFVQEDGRRDQICLAALEQTDGMFYFLESADGSYAGITNEDLDNMISADGFPLRFLEAQGYIYIADTLDEMAEKLGMDAETLKATVAQFNASVEAGEDLDGLGRTLYSTKLENGPFIATPRIPCLHHTMGGVSIDTEARVLDAEGNVIPGFVACGEVTGGIHGANRLGGNAVVDTVVFGKLAGETIVK